MVEGTSLGSTTDIDGKFSITNVPNSAKTLRVTYVGMQSQSLPILRGKVMHVTLRADAELLDEVMVVAFGTQKKSSFTGAASVVNSEQLSKHVTTNVANALVGSTPVCRSAAVRVLRVPDTVASRFVVSPLCMPIQTR